MQILHSIDLVHLFVKTIRSGLLTHWMAMFLVVLDVEVGIRISRQMLEQIKVAIVWVEGVMLTTSCLCLVISNLYKYCSNVFLNQKF